MTVVLDASALLAWMIGEPGAEAVEKVLSEAIMSSANWSEVIQKSLARDADVSNLRADLESLGLEIVAFDAEDAEQAAQMWAAGSGLSLADRACLALARRRGVPAWTTDSQWLRHASGAEVHLLRPGHRNVAT